MANGGVGSLWCQLVEQYARIAATDPTNNCSVRGNHRAELFADWLHTRLTGRVLDLGCGVQPVSVYLHPPRLDQIAGIDPIDAPHPFEFVCGRAETLPWPDGSFDTVVCATSLDHTEHPDRVLREVARVLADGGRFILWETIVEDGQDGPDEHHAFRLTFDRLLLLAREAGLIPQYFTWVSGPPGDLYSVWGKGS